MDGCVCSTVTDGSAWRSLPRGPRDCFDVPNGDSTLKAEWFSCASCSSQSFRDLLNLKGNGAKLLSCSLECMHDMRVQHDLQKPVDFSIGVVNLPHIHMC